MSTVKIGWAHRDISTDKPVLIFGQAHYRVSKGVHDPITATVLVVEDGDCAIMVSADLMLFTAYMHDSILKKVAAMNPEIPTDHIFMGSTHTHDGGPGYPDSAIFKTIDGLETMPVEIDYASCDEYVDFMSTQVAEGICEAWAGRKESQIAYGYGYAVVGHSRRVRYMDDLSKRGNVDATDTFAVNGHAAMYGNTNDDMFEGYEAGADHFINIMYTFDMDGKLTGAVVNVPCPSQNSESEWCLSASFWDEARTMLKAKYGDITILPQSACAGDLAPRILHYKKAQERRFNLKYGDGETISEDYARRDIAERIVEAFDEVLSWAKKDMHTSMPVVHKLTEVELESYPITEEEFINGSRNLQLARSKPFVKTDDPMKDFVANSRLLSDRNRFLGLMYSYMEQMVKKTKTMQYHVVKIGPLGFATINTELYMDYQHRIQARSPFEQVFMVQLCAQPARFCDYTGTFGYLATERAVEAKGYSAIPFSCSLSPKGGQQYVESVLKDMKEIY